jgi:hypothetical protein
MTTMQDVSVIIIWHNKRPLDTAYNAQISLSPRESYNGHVVVVSTRKKTDQILELGTSHVTAWYTEKKECHFLLYYLSLKCH